MIKHILSSSQFDLPFLGLFMKTAREIKELAETKVGKMLLAETLKGTMVGRFFWPPSSRTFHHFSVACQLLGAGGDAERGLPKEVPDGNGGKKIIWELPFSSEMKGAFFEDEIRAWASAYQVLVLRHYEEGYVERAAHILDNFNINAHVINAGGGPGEHPTQALIDLLAIVEHFHINFERDISRFKDMSIAFIGDNRYGRTVHSLAPLLGRLGMQLIFVSPPALSYPKNLQHELDKMGAKYEYADKLKHAQIFYVTRINRTDYFPMVAGQETQSLSQYTITQKELRTYWPDLVLHPFPRRTEIPIWLPHDLSTHHESIDKMPQAGYFRQMDFGVLGRMAVLKMVVAPHVHLRDLYYSHWTNSYTRQCICGRIENSILGWGEKPQPPFLYLPKIAECSFCAKRV